MTESKEFIIRFFADRWETVRELIRCRDCKYFNGENKYCDYNLTVESDDYCSFAERRAE